MAKAPDTILKLVENFEQNLESFKGAGYNETQLRREFIDPFFEALGWDIQNKARIAAAYKDVIHEDSIKIGGTTKAPDYCFRIGPAKKFFVEAKKPAVDIKTEISPAYQLRRYAWSAKLPLSILTDFEEFAVYDCQIRPNPDDKPSTARVLLLTYKDYVDKWDKITDIFSKEAVLKGAFDKFASEKTTKRGTTTVDKEFLAEIEKWREHLAKNIALRNSKLSVYDLNFAVQATIDRILFLRMCEDRGIERYGQLMGLVGGNRIYPRLFELFEKSDERYNSGLFYFRREKDRPEEPDGLSENLKIDDDVLKQILKELYYPHSPYEFSVLPAEILGNVYEQFLGKVIRLTSAHQAKVEEKPEVKKAGGVYYTPSYIVDYIVKNTVGKLCENKTPKQIEKLKILDPACGSGSFLIGAYNYLLNFHRDYYEKQPSKYRKQIYQGKGGQWFLTIDEKKRILLNNIYGVDIDSQAVEVTKLSLLLKVLENETQESLRLFHERALPDLGSNIKCGNSLIGPDFYQNRQLGLFGDEQQRKINAFDWQKEFSEILSGKNPGFDCVIGNPPYGYMIPKEQQDYFAKNCKFQDYQKDLYLLFFERYPNLIKEKGLLGIIVSNTWMLSVTYRNIRKLQTLSYNWLKILCLPEKVFSAVVDTHVLIFEKNKKGLSSQQSNELIVEKKIGNEIIGCHKIPCKLIPLNGDVINITFSQDSILLFQKINSSSCPLKDLSDVYNGIKPFEKGKGIPPQTEKTMAEKPFVKIGAAPNSKWSPLLRGSLINRYVNLWNKNSWILYGKWLAAPRDPVIFQEPLKIVVRQTGDSIIATLVEKGFIARNNLHILILNNQQYDYKYILGILNSKMMDFAYTNINPEKGEALAEVKKQHVESLPICPIDFKKIAEVKKHDKMVTLVEAMLELQKKISGIKNPEEKTRIQRQIDSTDSQIDKLVYELYNLSEEEVKIVEGKD
jgi:type I restriction-modification system DNA methylase subunit